MLTRDWVWSLTFFAKKFSASFAGNLLAGALGSYWTPLGPARFFLMIAGVAALAALVLRLADIPARRVLDPHAQTP